MERPSLAMMFQLFEYGKAAADRDDTSKREKEVENAGGREKTGRRRQRGELYRSGEHEMETDRCTRSGDGDQGTKATGEKEGRGGGRGRGTRGGKEGERREGSWRRTQPLPDQHPSFVTSRAARFPLVIVRLSRVLVASWRILASWCTYTLPPPGPSAWRERNQQERLESVRSTNKLPVSGRSAGPGPDACYNGR